MKRFVFILPLVFFVGFLQAQNTTKYQTADGDGYNATTSEVYIDGIFQEEAVCEGEDALFTMQVEGSLLYTYRWYKVGSGIVSGANSSFLSIKNCQMSYNGQKYFCRVTDLNSNLTVETDTFVLRVLARPTAKLVMAKDTTICYGQTVNLQVIPDVTEGYVYTWYGDGITKNPHLPRVTVQPKENTRYEVTVSNGTCVSDPVGVRVNVVHPAVALKEDLMYVRKGEAAKLTPVQPNIAGATFSWSSSYGAVSSGSKEFSVIMPDTLQEATVTLTLRNGKCSAKDSVRIINEQALLHFKGGERDGFIESRRRLLVSGITPLIAEVCHGEMAYFTCNVGNVGTYTYQWYRLTGGKSVSIPGAKENMLAISTDNMNVAGEYYCVVRDLDTKDTVTTDPATLNVVERPEVDIITESVTICKGEQAVLRADRSSDPDEMFRWNGVNIQTNPTYQEITVKPTETAVYQLMAKKGTCMMTKEVKVKVNEVQVHLPGVLDVLRGEKVTLGFKKESGVVYDWSVEGGADSRGDTLRFTPVEKTMVRVSKSLGRCVASDSLLVYLKEYGLPKNAEKVPHDGYTESILPFYIKEVTCPKSLCIDGEAIMNIEVKGYDVYQYTWKKRLANGTTVVVDTVKQHRIAKVKKTDSGSYFCEVKNVQSGEMRASDDVNMEVLDKPVAEIAFVKPSLGYGKESCWICAGSQAELRAREREGWSYLWDGLGFLGDVNKSSIVSAPEENTDISLVVSNGVCSDVAYVQVKVQGVAVDIPEVLFVPEKEAFSVSPLSNVPTGATLKWVYNNGSVVSAPQFKSSGVTQSGILKVTMTLDGCEANDSTRVYVRGYNSYQGGTEDGYIESNSSFLIQELRYPSVICENEDADFSVRVKGSGVYLYNWKQVGKSETLSSESGFSLGKCALSRNGERYYCLVTDLMLGKTLCSDTATLNIRKGPKAIINYPERGKSYCVGASIRLDARKTEDYKEPKNITYVYSWEGEQVKETEYPYAVDIRPTKTQVYTLKVSAENCSAYDTIRINIIDPRVAIPSVIYAEEKRTLSIEAEVSNSSMGATVNWWHNALFIPNVNPYKITDITESANIVAEVVDQGCKYSDTARVYVRTINFFAGGDDDGFMESCNIPEILPDVPTVLGCGGVDSVEMNVAYTGDPKLFVWQRYDKDAGKFVALSGNANLSGLGTPKLKIKPLTESFFGQYRCVLINDCGSTYSLVYKVSNGNAPETAIHPDTITACQSVKDYQILMPVKADSKIGELSYRWYKKNPVTGAIVQFTPEASFNKQAYVIPEVVPEHDAYYVMEAKGLCGTVRDSVRLIVNKKVSFKVQPNDTLVCYNTNVGLITYSKDGGNCSYSLKKVIPDNNRAEGYKIEKICRGNGSNRYDFNPISMEDDGYYVWTVRSSCQDSVTSRMFKVTVEKPVQFVSQTPDTTICIGTSLTLSVKAESPDCPKSNITYTWDKLGEERLARQAATLTMNTVPTTEGEYLCSASNVCGTVALENPIKVAVHPELVITKQPAWSTAGICEEASLELDFAVNLTRVVDSVRWYRRKSNGESVFLKNERSRITGANDYKLKIDSIQLAEAGQYYARIYNVCGVYETVALAIKVDAKAKIALPIEHFFKRKMVCIGEELDLMFTASGDGTLIYRWEKDGQILPDASENRLRVTFDKDVTYRCLVHNHCAQASSEHFIRVVQPDTFRLKQAGTSTRYCEGGAGVYLTLVGSDTLCTYSLYHKENSKATPTVVSVIEGKSASFPGASLNFGARPAGSYYVMSYDPRLECSGRMPGEVNIVMDSLPKVFNTSISVPICQGEVMGTIRLDSSQFSRSERYRYILQKQEGTDWQPSNRYISGTGKPLLWANVGTGIYRIKTNDLQTGCSSLMNGEVDLQERPNPITCNLVQYMGDTVYCADQEMKVAMRMNIACFTAGQTYTLAKDNVPLADQVRVDNSGWQNLKEGAYSVIIKNQWGCADTTNIIRIYNHPLPEKKQFSKSRFYCADDVREGNYASLKVENVDPDIEYAFWRIGEKAAFEKAYKISALANLTTEVSLTDAAYYVVATNPKTKCSVIMKDTVKIQGSRLELSHDPVTIDRTETLVKLNLTVANAVGKTKIQWEPQLQIKDLSDKLHPWVDMTDLTKDKFIVTVRDTICIKTDTIIVGKAGQALSATIKNSSIYRFERDTLWACEGSTYSLTGYVQGGKSPFNYEWLLDGASIGTGTKLTNAVADKSGNIVFRVGSNGRVTADTIRLELYSAPGNGLEVNTPDLCIFPGDALEMNLANMKQGVTYTLEYSKNNDLFSTTGVSVAGNASGTGRLRFPFTESRAGYYRVKASTTYNNKTTCHSLHGDVNIGVGVYNTAFHGGGVYCFRNEQDSLVLDSTIVGVNYELIYKSASDASYRSYSKVGAVAGTGDSLFFVGKWDDGMYRVIGKRTDGGCVDTLSGKVQLKHLSRPGSGTLFSDQMAYCITDDNVLKVTIALSDAVAGNAYKLYRQNGSNVELVATEIGNNSSDVITFGTEFSERGRYFSVADNGSCQDTAGYILIGKLPENNLPTNKIHIVKVDTGYCFGAEKDGIAFNLYPVGSDVHFYIYPKGGWGRVAECMLFEEDTVRFKGRLGYGDYVIKAELAECKKEIGEFTVEEYSLPERADILFPESGCEGKSLAMGVQTSQQNVSYELYYNAKKPSALKAKVYGTGKKLQLWSDSKPGSYEILARDTLTGCTQELDSYTIIPLPKNFDFFATDTVYCAFGDESGTQLALSGTELDIAYILQRYNQKSGEFEDVKPQAEIIGAGNNVATYFYGIYKAGKYRVRTTACVGSVVGNVLEIKEIALPSDTLAVELAGNACVDSTMTIKIKATQNEIKYSLWSGETQIKTALALTGNGSDLSWKVNSLPKGTYVVRAERVGATSSTCSVNLGREIEVGDLPTMLPLSGSSLICRYTTTNLQLPIMEDNVKYTLHNSRDGKKVLDGIENRVNVAFEGVKPGSYYAVAMRGDCKAVSPIHTIDSVAVPEIGKVAVSYSECTEQNAGWIKIQDMVDTLTYVLKYPGNTRSEEFGKEGYNATKTLKNLEVGDYYLQVRDEKTRCLSLKDTLRLYLSVPAGDTLIGPFGYCVAASRGARLNLGHSTMGICYAVMNVSGDTIERICGGMDQRFEKPYPQGKYRFVAERVDPYGGCRLTQNFEVKGFAAPSLTAKLELKETGALCAGNEYHISVLDARDTISYILYKGRVPIDTVSGNGKLAFKAVKEEGDYTVLPKNGGICGSQKLDTLFHLNALPADIRVEQPCSYCNPADATNEIGAALKIYSTLSKIRYILKDSITNVNKDTLYGDQALAYQEFKKMPKGSYLILATDSETGCSKLVGTGKIERKSEPERFICGTDGKRCEKDSALVGINDSESDMNYYLHKNGKKIAGPIAGAAGTSISFGYQKEFGLYQIFAASSSGCSVYMKDTVTVYPALVQDSLIVKGTYCEDGESNISFRCLNPTPLWNYYVLDAKNNASSDTLAGGDNWTLVWTEIGGKDIRNGKYRLYAKSLCGSAQLLDTVVIDTNHLPKKYPITEGNFTICQGDSGTITLASSQAVVEYDLIFRSAEGQERLVATQAGTGSKLLLASVKEAGEYIVIGRMKATKCSDTVAVARVRAIDGLENPNVLATDICLANDAGKKLDVSLSRKQDEVSYYLQHIRGVDTLKVDSIIWGASGTRDLKSFKSQATEGIYQVVAQGPSCKKVFKAGRIGKGAANQAMNSAGEVAICDGSIHEISLKGSQTGVEYEVFRVDPRYYGGYDTITMNIIAEGTGNALPLGKLDREGVYVVKANNGCTVLMNDTLKLAVKTAFKVNLRTDGYTLCNGDSVRIEIVGETTPVSNAYYEIYAPGKTRYSETVDAGNKGASVASKKWYKEPGFYRVKVIDYSDCIAEDSVKIKILPLPEVHQFKLRSKNKYVCDQQTKKELVVEGAQSGVDYYLFRKGETSHVTMKTARTFDFEEVFEVYQEGVYYVMGNYNDKGSNTCPVKMSGEVELAPVAMSNYALESVRDIYCGTLPGSKGEAKLAKSDLGVKYQLYKDGVPYGDPKLATVAGEPLVWSGLPGGVPKMDADLQDNPIKYTVVATDTMTGCAAEMNGVVNVIAEREIVFDAKRFQNMTLPSCLGSKLNIAILAYGGRISYQWRKGKDTVANGRQYYYAKEAMTEDDIGFYSCQMTNTCGTVTTPQVEVAPALLVDKAVAPKDSIVVCNLGAEEIVQRTLSSRATNAEKWEWYKDGVRIGQDKEIYRWLDIKISRKSGTGIYTSKAFNACGSVWDTCVVMLDSTPRLELLAPVRRDTLCVGSSWEVRVKADHSVTWLKGMQKTAYLKDTLKIDRVTMSDEGAYTVVSANRCGVKKAEAALLIVDTAIRVISEQERFYVCRRSGELPYMFLQTTPKVRVYYRWEDRKGTVLSKTNELNGIDLKKYTALVDTFRVYYGNKCQDSYKDIALVTSDYIQFKQPVKDIKACVMDRLPDTVLRVEVLNGQKAVYKWYKVNQSDPNVPRDSVGNADSLRIHLNQTRYAGYYYCYIANRCVDTVSRMVNVCIDTLPQIRRYLPKDTTLCSGSQMKLQVAASAGSGSLHYMWYIRKKGKKTEKVDSMLYFGPSMCEYTCMVDTTYNEAKVWCNISTSCSAEPADTLRLTILPEPKVSMTPLLMENCEGVSNKIYVRLNKGTGPWKYKYAFNEEESAVSRSVAGEVDTLEVMKAGTYRVHWLQTAQCLMSGKELAVTQFQMLRRSKYAIEAENYKGTVCPATEVTLKVKITGNVPGPWMLGIYRSDNGELASELGFDNLAYLTDSVYTCKTTLQKSETYFAKVQNVYGQRNCEAEALVKEIKLDVFNKPEIKMNDLKPEDRILSSCNNVPLRTLFNVQPSEGGWYVIDGQEQSGDWLLNPDQKKYTIGYSIYKNDCRYDDYNLGDIEFRPRPTLKKSIEGDSDKVLCGTMEGAKVKFKAPQGEYPIKVIYRVLNLKKNGQTTLVSTPDASLASAKDSIMIRFTYDENLAGKIVEVVRVEDKFKCIATNGYLATLKDTILFLGRPDFDVSTKLSNGDWISNPTKERLTYNIRKGDSLAIRVGLKEGKYPWMLKVGEMAIRHESYVRPNIQTTTFDTALYEQGFYEIEVADKYCPMSIFDGKYQYIDLSVIDTAFLKLKVYLQGPWNAASNKMQSSVLSRIDKHGLTDWPNVGSKKIIDWVEVELWDSQTEKFWDSQRCLLLDDGTVVDTKGNDNLKLIGKTSAMEFRVAIRCRNHLAVWSKAVDLSKTDMNNPFTLDFTRANMPGSAFDLGVSVDKYVYNSSSGKLFLYAGEVNIIPNDLITSVDPNRIPRDILSLSKLSQANADLLLDVDYNGVVEWPGYGQTGTKDWSIIFENRQKYSIVPNRKIDW